MGTHWPRVMKQGSICVVVLEFGESAICICASEFVDYFSSTSETHEEKRTVIETSLLRDTCYLFERHLETIARKYRDGDVGTASSGR